MQIGLLILLVIFQAAALISLSNFFRFATSCFVGSRWQFMVIVGRLIEVTRIKYVRGLCENNIIAIACILIQFPAKDRIQIYRSPMDERLTLCTVNTRQTGNILENRLFRSGIAPRRHRCAMCDRVGTSRGPCPVTSFER
jgi:hypothetical protein